MTELYKTLNPVEDATEVILRTMRIAEDESKSHPPGSWAKEDVVNHLEHAYEHMQALYGVMVMDNPWGPEDDENLEHALCHLAMAIYVRRHSL